MICMVKVKHVPKSFLRVRPEGLAGYFQGPGEQEVIITVETAWLCPQAGKRGLRASLWHSALGYDFGNSFRTFSRSKVNVCSA